MIKDEEYVYGFEKLIVWQNAVQFVSKLYVILNKFPKEEIYGLTSQIKRAAISIPSNIAEGTSRKSLKDQSRYTEIAYGSLLEVLNDIIVARNLNYINEEQYNIIRIDIVNLSRQLNSLKLSQINRQNK